MLDSAEIAQWKTWVGREETRGETVDAEALRRYAAALGEPLGVERTPPSLAHWACFLPVAPPDGLGPDGHPKRGGFLPPITLPRRMFAATDIRIAMPLRAGAEATRISRILGVDHKAGRSGELVLVSVEHEIEQDGQVRVIERQTIVYRDASEPTAPVVPGDIQVADGDILWQPSSIDLFRFSAVTFNSHRIHYDLPYATGEERYPGLVVHGPFTAARLYGLAARAGAPSRFAFRAQAPLFAGQPIRLRTQAADSLAAIRCDGITAMTAMVEY